MDHILIWQLSQGCGVLLLPLQALSFVWNGKLLKMTTTPVLDVILLRIPFSLSLNFISSLSTLQRGPFDKLLRNEVQA